MKEQKMSMKELPSSEQPYEKAELYGIRSLSDAELLAVILRTGSRRQSAVEMARGLLSGFPGRNIAGLFQVTAEELREIDGIGKVKAVQLLALGEIVKRMMKSKVSADSFCCTEPEKVAAYFMQEMRYLDTEKVKLLILNGKNVIMKEIDVAVGAFDSAQITPRELFYYALKYKAVSILLLHNHPSGDPTPSKDDFIFTKRVAESGNLIGISLTDHIVIGDNCYTSFRESGYLV